MGSSEKRKILFFLIKSWWFFSRTILNLNFQKSAKNPSFFYLAIFKVYKIVSFSKQLRYLEMVNLSKEPKYLFLKIPSEISLKSTFFSFQKFFILHIKREKIQTRIISQKNLPKSGPLKGNFGLNLYVVSLSLVYKKETMVFLKILHKDY